MEAVAGGLDGYCYVIGGSDGGVASDEYNKGTILCYYAGIGIFSA